MKWLWVVLVVFGLVATVGFGAFFVFGDEVLKAVGDDRFFGGDSYSDDREYDDGGDLVEGDEGFVSGGGGSVGGGGDSDDVYICPTDPLQYSLTKFISDVECLVYGVGGCESVKMVCSAELRNLDYEVGGIFGIEYSLVSDGEILEARVIETDIAPRAKSVFRTEIFVEGEFDVGALECAIDMENVPVKCR